MRGKFSLYRPYTKIEEADLKSSAFISSARVKQMTYDQPRSILLVSWKKGLRRTFLAAVCSLIRGLASQMRTVSHVIKTFPSSLSKLSIFFKQHFQDYAFGINRENSIQFRPRFHKFSSSAHAVVFFYAHKTGRVKTSLNAIFHAAGSVKKPESYRFTNVDLAPRTKPRSKVI